MRSLIKEIPNLEGETVELAGSVSVRRDHGKLIFLDLRDRSGIAQLVFIGKDKALYEKASTLRAEWVIGISGKVNKRPAAMVNKDIATGAYEVLVETLEILSEAKDLPFDLGSAVNVDTYLDYLPYSLRDAKAQSVFRVQAAIIKAFRDFLTTEGFVEFQAPKLIGEDAEGGANSFNIEYFGHTAHLAQSPQLYKQIMVGVFERVFAAGNVYRAEKHSTTRHLNEYTSLDIEMGFVKDHTDVMDMETLLIAYIMQELKERCPEDFKRLNAEIPVVPTEIPRMKLREAQELIKKEFGVDCENAPDLEPQHERFLCEYAQKMHKSDFIFITHFPISKRPFYTYEDESDPGYAKGFDLLFRGVEITTGAQRIHNYDMLVASMKKKKLDPEKFSFYLQAFKYGLPPHGGLGLGLERLTAKLLGLENIKEATLFPRDINRIDNLLSR